MRHFLSLLLFCCACGTGAVHAAEENIGEYTIHYIAVNSTFLTPEIAEQYGIVRGSRNAFLNIAVLRNEADGSTTPVTATLDGHLRNLMQQETPIEFQEIREGAATYYIGQFRFSDSEVLSFTVNVQPEGQGASHTLEWRAQLYAQ